MTTTRWYLGIFILLAALGAALCLARPVRGPIYLYTQHAATGLCTEKDSNMLYTAVERGTPGAHAIQANLGNYDGKGRCDTIYVLKQPW